MGADQNKVIRRISKELYELKFDDQSGIDNYFFEKMFDVYLSRFCSDIEKWIDTICEKQTEKKRSYGDIDWSVTIFENTVDKRVLYFDNHCSCADETQFIIIQDRKTGFTHLRTVYNKSDYKKGNNYVHRPNLKWYKDRKFSLEFDEKLHRGPLGGSYGDCRDNGFLMTFSKGIFFKIAQKITNRKPQTDEQKAALEPFLKDFMDSVKKHKEYEGISDEDIAPEYEVEQGSLGCYGQLKRAIFDLSGSAFELNEE